MICELTHSFQRFNQLPNNRTKFISNRVIPIAVWIQNFGTSKIIFFIGLDRALFEVSRLSSNIQIESVNKLWSPSKFVCASMDVSNRSDNTRSNIKFLAKLVCKMALKPSFFKKLNQLDWFIISRSSPAGIQLLIYTVKSTVALKFVKF